MPKLAEFTLAWSNEEHSYQLRSAAQTLAMDDPVIWARWLDEHNSFSFKGRQGILTLLKEGRKGSGGYWYAYRRQGKRTQKRYAGRSDELTWARLEELAEALAENAEAQDAAPFVPQPPSIPQVNKKNEENVWDKGIAKADPLLTPKLLPPRLHSSLVRRERLLAQLESGSEGKLTIVSAPAGFGKTTLVRQWIAEVGEQSTAPAVAWLSLDRSDNDPFRFWRYLITACRVFAPEVGRQSLALLEEPMSIRSPLDTILTTFVNELANGLPESTSGSKGESKRESILVLEEYHLITTPLIHESVSFLLDHLPPTLHLILITRATPPLPLARLRAAGELTEIEAPELRFSGAETATFLSQMGPHALPPGEIAQVEKHVEGWAAGLRLLALAFEGEHDTGKTSMILANFAAGRRGIGDYFVSEVLNNQPAPVQLFVLQTSFLNRLTASLCDSVIGRSDSQTMLELLEEANLFLEPLDGLGLWYRYHALFATAMQTEARRRLGESTIGELLERAGTWYEEQGMLDEAIETALTAEVPKRAARIIERLVERQFSFEHPTMHYTPEFYTLRRWLNHLPEELMAEHPLLNLALATAILFTYLMEMQPPPGIANSEIEQLLVKAEQGFKANGESGRLGQVFAFRGLMLRERGEIAAAVAWAKAALDLLPPQEMAWRNVCVANLGDGELYTGHLDNAARYFVEACAMCETLGNRTFARANASMLSWVLLEQNQLHRAAALADQLLAEARAVNDIDDIGHNLQTLAEINFCWNDLDAAWSAANEVVEVTHHYAHEPYHIHSILILARVEQARGQIKAALARCAALLAGRKAVTMPADRQLNAQIEFEQARIALAAGEFAIVRQWQESRPDDLEMTRLEQARTEILLARLRMMEGEPDATLSSLETRLIAIEAAGCERVALEMRVPLALAYHACGERQKAQQTLTTALAAAAPANAQGLFINGGMAQSEALSSLLRATLTHLGNKNLLVFAKTILRALDGVDSRPLPAVDALSPQERRVLRLIAAGRSNPEIAADLIVSVNTVKTHIKNIYQKLNVGSRLAATRVAHDLNLL